MIKRPKPGESEEELLRMQEEYLQDKSRDPNYRPAAQVTSLRKEPTKGSASTGIGPKKLSKYAQAKGLIGRAEKQPTTELAMGDILEKNLLKSPKENTPIEEDDKVYYPTVIPFILGKIIEKNVDVETDFDFPTMPSQGFPEVNKRDPNIVIGDKSIHRHYLKRELKEEIKMDVDESNSNATKITSKSPNLPSKSYIVTSQEANDIHNENLKILNSMSEPQILEEQQKLLGNLDPRLVDFIKAKRQQKLENEPGGSKTKKRKSDDAMDTSESVLLEQVQPSEKSHQTLQVDSSTESQTDSLWENDILSHPDLNNWLNFNSFEKDKLEWMKGIQDCKNVNPDEPYEARFDFKGYLLPYTIEYTEQTKALFHHGEEPHRPGYTLNELIELSRSSITQQRVMALNTIAGILEYHSAGTYKGIIELPLSKIFFIIRIALDENKVTILEPGLKAMRNLLYNRIDEAGLDALIGFEEDNIQPCLENDKSEISELDSKESELKDFHLAEIDLIAAILRTEILQRLYYILDTIRPNLNCVQYALQILTRLVRDSIDTSLRIVQSEHLMKAIIKNFIPVTTVNFVFDPQMVYKKPILSAVRLFRILCLQSKEISSILVDKYEILKPIAEYISSGVDRTYGLRIQIEAYYLLSNLLCHKSGEDQAVSLLPVVISALYKHVQGTDLFSTSVISVTHAAAVLQLINKLLEPPLLGIDGYQTQLHQLIQEGMQKWITQCSQAEFFTNAHLRFLWSVLNCSKTCQLLRNPSQIQNFLKHLSSSQEFNLILKNLIPCSNLLSGFDNTYQHSIKNLLTLGGTVVDSPQKVLPILNPASPLPFLTSLFKMLTNLHDKTLSVDFSRQLLPYLNNFVKKTPALTDNWFTRLEIDFVFYVLRMAVQTHVNECDKDLFYVAANKLCYIFRSDKHFELEFLFNKIVFNQDWFTAERLLHLVNISYSDGLSQALQSIEEIKKCYSNTIKLSSKDVQTCLPLLEWKEPILPRDWIYLPILLMYSRRHEYESTLKKDTKEDMEEKESVIACSLEWILFNELCFPDLLNDINVTDRFCRIMCVFLCDNTLFLDAKIKVLLQKCMHTLFKRKAEYNFDKELVGLHNFQDFYTEFLEQFQSVSYGDPAFAACVLVPLAQRHNVKWRKLIWSEYAGCLRALDCPEELLCYELKEYLHPEETDESLIKSYFRALSSNLLRPGTVAHKIAKHHVECFRLRSQNDKQ